MPKLAEAPMRKRKHKVEAAALKVFCAVGFHGAGLRDIARTAGVSLGNIYNHYANKEALFDAILTRLHDDFTGADTPLAAFFAVARFPDDIEALGFAVRDMVEEHAAYLTLIYIDLIEFGGRHVRPFYQSLPVRFRAALKVSGPLRGGTDPVVGFTAAYMQFFNYFIVEHMIGASGHFGVPDDEAIHTIARILRHGLVAA